MRLRRSIAKKYTQRFAKTSIYERRGLSLLLNPNNYIDFRLIAGLPYEVPQIEKAMELTQEHNFDIFIDAGANIGLYSALLAVHRHIPHIHAFEPVRANFNQLCANIFINHIDQRVTPYRIALGDTETTAEIHIDPESTGRSRIDSNYSNDAELFTQKEEITVKPLDTILNFSQKKIFLKIDVEGHAAKALRGMESLLKNNDVIIQAELLSYDRDDIINTLNEYGYTLSEEIDDDGYFYKK